MAAALETVKDPIVPPAKLDVPISSMPPGWNDSWLEWKLPDSAYSKERREEMWKKYQMCLQFEKENNFREQSNMFLSDYKDLLDLKKEMELKKEQEKKEGKEKKEEEVIKLSRPIDFEDLDYLIDHYDYDPNDDVVNNFNDVEAENFIRSKVIEYRKSIGKQI